jgi:hypothetical protein
MRDTRGNPYDYPLNERGETWWEWADRTGQMEPSDEFLAECAATEAKPDDGLYAAQQQADTERWVSECGDLLTKCGYTGWPCGNGYYAVFASLTPGSRIAKFGRLDEVKAWLDWQGSHSD